MNEVILVNMSDEPLGTMEKLQAHEQAKLHRAFSVFLFHKDCLLMQQRAKGKYHCGGLWTNTCCSHPIPGEETEAAAHRRLCEELGIETVELKEAGCFVYRYPFSNGLTEFEFDHVFIGEYNGSISPDPSEIEAAGWERISSVMQGCAESPEKYTPWFLTAIGIALKARGVESTEEKSQ